MFKRIFCLNKAGGYFPSSHKSSLPSKQQPPLFPLGLTQIFLQSYISIELGAWLPEISRELKRAGSLESVHKHTTQNK